MTTKVVVFDAYGTLFDVAAAAREAAARPGGEAIAESWPRLAELWRRKQLEYTWLRAITGAHADFWRVTCDALAYAMEAQGIADDRLEGRLREIYLRLAAYPEATEVLAALKAQGFATAILSNGAPMMLDSAVASAGLGPLLDAVLSVEEVGVYKPAPAVYALVGTRFGTAPGEVLFVSSNGWDAAGATGFGFRTVWVNRGGDPVDRLPWTPSHVETDLRAVVGHAGA
jgi:2-haloacid dehalogenase